MDLTLVGWIARHLHTPMLDRLMPVITALGNYGAVWIALSILLMICPKTRRTGLICAASLALSVLLGELVLKNIIARARPFAHIPGLALLITAPSTYSFPSGHTASAFAVAGAVWLSYKKHGWWALGLAAAISFSRLYLSVHYLTDVLGGALLGALCAWLVNRCFEKKRVM